MFEEVELMSVGRRGKYSCIAPVNVVLHVVARRLEDWKKLFSSDEAMVAVKNAC